MNLQTLPVVLYLSSLRFCMDSGVWGTTREVSIGATSSCPGIRVRPATTTVAATAKHALKSRACAPLSNLRNTKGHAVGSCHPLPDSLPSSTSFSNPRCPLPDHQSQSLFHSSPPPPPMPSGNLSPGHWEMPPCRPPSVHCGNGFWQP